MFYLLSLITGVLECGWIAYGAVHSLPLWQMLCFPLAYHLGNLFPKPFSVGKIPVLCMAAVPAGMALLLAVAQLSEILYHGIACAALACLSAAIQSVRSDLKSDGNRLMKRVFRVGGFALAPIAAIVPELVLLIASVISCIAAARHYHGRTGITKLTGQGGFSAVMIFHQLHYFFYAHITLAAVTQKLNGTFYCGGVWRQRCCSVVHGSPTCPLSLSFPAGRKSCSPCSLPDISASAFC